MHQLTTFFIQYLLIQALFKFVFLVQRFLNRWLLRHTPYLHYLWFSPFQKQLSPHNPKYAFTSLTLLSSVLYLQGIIMKQNKIFKINSTYHIENESGKGRGTEWLKNRDKDNTPIVKDTLFPLQRVAQGY